MSYLSQINIEKAEAARLCLRDAYVWHQQLWQAFPGKHGQHREFLFRVDDKHDYFRVILLSQCAPKPTNWGRWESKHIGTSFLNHELFRFQVRVNPTVKRVVHDDAGKFKKNGRRTGIYDHASLVDWMNRKARLSGFTLIECHPGPAIHACFHKDGRRGNHIAVDFQGILHVQDHDAFENSFNAGIGPAKAFGFGLLMLQPVAKTTGLEKELGNGTD